MLPSPRVRLPWLRVCPPRYVHGHCPCPPSCLYDATELLILPASPRQDAPTGKLDSSTISEITSREAELTGNPNPAKGGPTAQAQKHVGESIGSENLHDITEGEKKVTGGERVKGGPTAAAQSELGKSRS